MDCSSTLSAHFAINSFLHIPELLLPLVEAGHSFCNPQEAKALFSELIEYTTFPLQELLAPPHSMAYRGADRRRSSRASTGFQWTTVLYLLLVVCLPMVLLAGGARAQDAQEPLESEGAISGPGRHDQVALQRSIADSSL